MESDENFKKKNQKVLRVNSLKLLEEYNIWAQQSNNTRMQVKRFSEKMNKNGYEKVSIKGYSYWVGIDL